MEVLHHGNVCSHHQHIAIRKGWNSYNPIGLSTVSNMYRKYHVPGCARLTNEQIQSYIQYTLYEYIMHLAETYALSSYVPPAVCMSRDSQMYVQG